MSLLRNIVLFMTPFLLSCGFYPSVPMEKVVYKNGASQNKVLVVLLRGFGGSISYFEDHNWIAAAKQISGYADFVAPDSHYGYYANKTFIERLHEDVILPAKKQGYQEIWLVGISMGGMGSILYSSKYPDDINRIYFFAPYLGDGEVQNEIRASGGIGKWHMAEQNAHNWQYAIWERLKTIIEDPSRHVKIFIGYGDKDKLDGHDLLAKYLPDNHIVKIPGGHKDAVFFRLWEIMLARGFLQPDKTIF